MIDLLCAVRRLDDELDGLGLNKLVAVIAGHHNILFGRAVGLNANGYFGLNFQARFSKPR